MTQLASIQGESTSNGLSPGIKCRAGWRHIAWDGNVYVRVINSVTYWVAVLQCTCGVWRVTKYTPNTGLRVGVHKYDYTSARDYPNDKTQEECLQLWLESLLTKGDE
jgi:hypothetical protein